jgi:hypothetical protein
MARSKKNQRAASNDGTTVGYEFASAEGHEGGEF